MTALCYDCDEFYKVRPAPLTPDTATIKGRIVQAIGSQKRPTVTVLSSLLAAQDELGYLPDEAIEEVATFTDTTVNEVWGVASFYTNFRFTPRASTLLRSVGVRHAICRGAVAFFKVC